MKRELLMTKKPTSWLARVRTFLSLIPFYLFFLQQGGLSRLDEGWQGGQGPREDEGSRDRTDFIAQS